jgi:methyltransferase family protein
MKSQTNRIDRTIYDGLELLPEDWGGWHGLHDIFGELIARQRPRHIIEVGTWKGQSAITMGRLVKELGLDCKITCVDTWLGSLEFWAEHNDAEHDLMQSHGYPLVYFQFLSNVVRARLTDVILPFPATSLTAARFFKLRDLSADLIYIDASHEEEDVAADLDAYLPLVKPGGILFGDDYGIWPGVTRAVDRFAAENQLTLEIAHRMFWMFKR